MSIMLGTYECEQEKSSPGLICHVMRQGAVGHLHRHGAMAGRKLLIVISSPWQKNGCDYWSHEEFGSMAPFVFGLMIQFDEIYVYEYVYV